MTIELLKSGTEITLQVDDLNDIMRDIHQILIKANALKMPGIVMLGILQYQCHCLSVGIDKAQEVGESND